MKKKLIVIIATLVLVLLVFAPVTYAAPPASGGWNDCGITCYRVHYGDTLFSIGRRFNVNPWYLAQVNHLRNPNWIYAGQVLKIPDSNCCAPPYPWPAKNCCARPSPQPSHHWQPRPMPYDGGYGRGYGYGSDGYDNYGGYDGGYGYGNDGYDNYGGYGYGAEEGVDPQYSDDSQLSYYGGYQGYDDGSGY